MNRVFGSLLILGCTLFVVGLYIRTLDRGSCPMIPANSANGCYHTFPGTEIYITPFGNALAFVGTVILVLGLALSFREHSSVWRKVEGR